MNTARLGIAALAPGVPGETKPRHKRKRVDRFLGNVGFRGAISTLLPDPAWITIVADRGFGRAALFPFIESLGMLYVVRVRGCVHVGCPRWSGLLEKYPIREGSTVDLGPVVYREDGVARTRVVVHWARGGIGRLRAIR